MMRINTDGVRRGAVVASVALIIAGFGVSATRADDDDFGVERSRVRIGFAVAPVPLNVKGKDGKNKILVFDTDADKKHHDDICQKKQDGTVSGTVKKDGDKTIITVTELKFK